MSHACLFCFYGSRSFVRWPVSWCIVAMGVFYCTAGDAAQDSGCVQGSVIWSPERKRAWKRTHKKFQQKLWNRALGFHVVILLLRNVNFSTGKKKTQLIFWPSPCGNSGYDFAIQHLGYRGVHEGLLLKSTGRMAVLLKLWCQGVWIPKRVGRRRLKKIVIFNYLISEGV